jgi:hypothetical protein
MVNGDVVKCPLCGGFTHVEHPNLLAALRDPHLREQVEKYTNQLLKSPVEEFIGVVRKRATISERRLWLESACPCGGAVRKSEVSKFRRFQCFKVTAAELATLQP